MGLGKFQPSRYYGLGCRPDTEIETKALRLVLGDYVIVGTVKIDKLDCMLCNWCVLTLDTFDMIIDIIADFSTKLQNKLLLLIENIRILGIISLVTTIRVLKPSCKMLWKYIHY